MSDIWKTLSPVDVNEHKKSKGKFDYLSWTYAWKYVKDRYPEANYEVLEDRVYADGSVEVYAAVTIENIRHVMWLAVTDMKNKAIPNPSCDAVSNARMRCLVKAIGMHGLGFYIYAGESLPEEPGADEEDWENFLELLSKKDAVRICEYTSSLTEAQETDLFNMAPQGQKTKFKQTVREFEKSFQLQVEAYVDGIRKGIDEDESAVIELLAELSEDKFLKGRVWKMLTPVQQHELKSIVERNAS